MKPRLIAVNGRLVGPPPPPVREIVDTELADDVLTTMRLAAAIIERTPDNGADYSPDELAAQIAATDRMVQAFRVLDRLLTSRGVSTNGRPTNPRKREK